MILFRTFTAADIDEGMKLCRIAGWNQIEDDWKYFLAAGAESSLAAVDTSGRIAGTVTTIHYDTFAWIGMLLVHPDFRRLGLGSALLNESIRLLGPNSICRLDATPVGREVYRKLDFHDQYGLTRMYCDHVSHLKHSDSNIRKMTQDDLPRIGQWDEMVFGANRIFLLRSMFSNATSAGWIYEANGVIGGYTFLRDGYNFLYAGPIVSKDLSVAKALVESVLRFSDGRSLAIDITEYIPEWKSYLMSIGFIEQRSFIRMYHGHHPGNGQLDEMFAIAGPEYG